MNIREIEKTTQNELELLVSKNEAEKMNIKGFDCYFTDLHDYFGYSVLVFKNNHHIHYVNDYELHHRGKTHEELKAIYIRRLNSKLFTDSELLENVPTYDEHERKSYFVRNYWIMQFDRVSTFCIGEESAELKEAKKNMYFCSTCFCYVKDESIAKAAFRYIDHIEKSFADSKKSETVFREMVRYELANHEACITCDYRDALDTLGLNFENLEKWQKLIVNQELKRQVEAYA